VPGILPAACRRSHVLPPCLPGGRPKASLSRPSRFVVSHHLSLDDAPKGYEMFKHKQDNCTKVVLKA
jgi:hypothetical protein